MKRVLFSTLCIFSLFLSTSCGSYYKLERSDDWEAIYNAGITYYEKKEYNRALVLLERVIPVYKGSEKAEKAEFYYAYCKYHAKLYLEASFHFKSFYDAYNRSPFAEEALYMHGYSLYKDSPEYNLDQQSTKDAVNALQVFVNRYPNSEYAVEASEIIGNLQVKFERKAYEEAILYYKLTKGIYPRDHMRAAIQTFQGFPKLYPDSKYNEELHYLLVETAIKYADNSFDALKAERMEDALKFSMSFLEKYPTSRYTKEVNDFKSKAEETIKKTASNK